MDAGQILREARTRAGLSQRALADQARVPQPAVARIESGRVIPRVDTLEHLLRICGEALESHPRLGIGLDRTVVQSILTRSIEERVLDAAEGSRNLIRLAARQRDRPAPSFDPIATLRALASERVRYVLVGTFAGSFHGSNAAAERLELCAAEDAGNVRRLVEALRSRNAPPAQLRAVEKAGVGRRRHTVRTTDGLVRVVLEPFGISAVRPGYQSLEANATSFRVAQIDVPVASISDLMRLHAATAEVEALMELEILGALREEIDTLEGKKRMRRRKKPPRKP